MQNIPSLFADLLGGASEKRSKTESLFSGKSRDQSSIEQNKSLFAKKFGKNSSDSSEDGINQFESIFSSFIEEGRSKYTGLPTGFSALKVEGGTLNTDQVLKLQKNLKKNNAHAFSLEGLDQIMSSNTPMTVGNILTHLTGKSRIHEEMSDDERASLRLILNKAGANTLESDDFIDLSDRGQTKVMWNRFADKVSSMPYESLDLQPKETLALLKSLDLSKATAKEIMEQFGKNESLTLTKEQLNDFFAPARSELSKRDNAQRYVGRIARDVLSKSLDEAKIDEKHRPVADIRGSAISDRLEAKIQESANNKSGLNDLFSLDDDEEAVFSIAQQARAENAKDLKVQNNAQSQDERAEKISTLTQNIRENISGSKDEKSFDLKDEPSEKDNKFQANKDKNTSKVSSKSNETEELGTVRANTVTRDITETNAAASFLNRLDTAFVQNPVGNAGQHKNLTQLARENSQEIFEQVKSGFLQNNKDGSSSITMQLDPKDLGQLSVILSMREGEIRASIRTEQLETATVLSEQMEQLRSALEEQGLKVAEIDIRQGLEEEANPQFWNEANEHNFMHDSEERDRSRRLAQIRRASPLKGAEENSPSIKAGLNDGLHIVA